MNTEKSRFNFPAHQQGYIALFLWVILAALLLRSDVYGIDEQAARPLLMSWSIADQVASSVTTFGMPDLRIVLFLPVGFLWTGSIFAAKVLTAVVLGATAWLMYNWRSRVSGAEGALLATGLLLISPIALAQIEAVAAGVYLLACFALGAWLDVQYRANPRPFNGWFFAQLFVCAFSASLHPAGLAYPLALLWSWRTLPQPPKYQRFFLGGTIFLTLFILLLRMGWGEVSWLQNPLMSLSTVISGTPLDDAQTAMQWLPGAAVLALAVAAALFKFRELWADLGGRTLLLGLLLGLSVGDQAWALIVESVVLYAGVPLLLRPQPASAEGGFMKQRGWVLLVIFACSTLFMRADKTLYEAGHSGMLSAQDELIKTLALAAEGERKAAETDEGENKRPRFIVASQWPGRTMLACKCDTFPLPPVEKDPQTQLAKLRGITYLLLDPKQTANIDLARNFSLLGGTVETVSLQPGGVLLHVKEDAQPKPEAAPQPAIGAQ